MSKNLQFETYREGGTDNVVEGVDNFKTWEHKSFIPYSNSKLTKPIQGETDSITWLW